MRMQCTLIFGCGDVMSEPVVKHQYNNELTDSVFVSQSSVGASSSLLVIVAPLTFALGPDHIPQYHL